MEADIHIFFRSDVYQVVDFKCHCNICSLSQPEYNQSFCLSFVRKGFFEYRTFRQNSEVHAGRILLSKPGYEHLTRHVDHHPDITTVFEFRASFMDVLKVLYKNAAGGFFLDNDRHSLMLRSNPALEYLHRHILQKLQSGSCSRLEMDELVFALLEKTMQTLSWPDQLRAISAPVRKYHLSTMEMARDFILLHFREEISVDELARYCSVSPFHFSRMFKSVYQLSPYQYLRQVRLQHAKILIDSTSLPVADIAFDSGFNSAENFSTAFRKQFGSSPSSFRPMELDCK